MVWTTGLFGGIRRALAIAGAAPPGDGETAGPAPRVEVRGPPSFAERQPQVIRRLGNSRTAATSASTFEPNSPSTSRWSKESASVVT